ncbi:4-alpha-glucanotransferase [Spirulina subsalsa FACHB-351]|uniref:4-alpha-glucanotransferase n=1 Tax=Spirulina subsalsa FACHB-351 TaxID=234711 RepID=A0ABT3L4Q7_9CYAN|nr:4-alpha-glucanotransferase [Spirulina subsalsa]MCW6036491.1 4-alpha-glucanotransferase [Spirulina subsalsa FACHB-351]
MPFERASGILLHPTSLPSRFGIGDLGQSAYEFVDFLVKSGQKLWQILPLGPTGYEHSPYTMNFSAFGGNPLLISLEQLAAQGLLNGEDLNPLTGDDIEVDRVNYDRVIAHKSPYLAQAYEVFKQQLKTTPDPVFEQFCRDQAWWLDDYVLFMAIHEQQPDKMWQEWEGGLARRDPVRLKEKREELADRILYHKFVQYIFFEQWTKLRKYANEKGIQIIGDVSIYVCENSAEVWSHPEIFKLDAQTLEPLYRAGVPPDYFSATGQLWGNPVYDWDKLQETGFAWWIERFRATLQYVDVVRIDHFRGFEAYWQVPGKETNAIKGEWIPCPGGEFFETLGQQLGSLPVLAEDLGIITPEVEELRDRFDFPGMKILLFAFGGGADHPYLPHNFPRNCLVYTGTHDNDTTLGWWAKAEETERQNVAKYLGYDSPEEIPEVHWGLIRLALSSVANQAIIPLQDLLGLDNRGRMNDPSVNAGNWRWRYESSAQLSDALAERLGTLTELYNR